MTRNPDPSITLENLQGTTRTLDDWMTMFHLCCVILPDRPEAREWLPVVRRILRVLGDADCHVAICLTASAAIAHKILDDDADEFMVFIDPDHTFVGSLGLTHLPAFVHLGQDTSLIAAAVGWNPAEWQRVADEIAQSMGWKTPTISGPNDPEPTTGWAI